MFERYPTGVTIVDDGIEKAIEIQRSEAIYPYKHTVIRVYAEPTEKGRETENYRKIKDALGDDWSSDITNCWFDPGFLPDDKLIAVNEKLREVRGE